jgi:hypothetical protein
MKQISRFCKNCQERTLHSKAIFEGRWGCLLTIFTGGLFLPFWLLANIFDVFKPYRCQQCGGKKLL